jgi:L-ascorbate metabolism protein UlaG (beta-lactamase superfamily)
MTTTITFHGISTYEVSGPNGRVLFDPFLTGNPAAVHAADDLAAPDVIVVSHAAWDHMADAAPIAIRTGAPVVCGTDTAALLEQDGVPPGQIRRTTNGIKVGAGGLVVRPVACAHWSQAKLADGRVITGVPMAFVVEFEPGVRVYHFGDSAITAEMSLIGRVHRPTVGLLGVTQPWSLVAPGGGQVVSGEMSPHEAALAAEMLGVRYAVATHYEDHRHPDVAEFLRLVPEEDSTGSRVPLALAAGESLVISGDSHQVVSR